MSHTVVTNYSNASGKPTNSDNSLVILVNKDGSVLLEKDTIQSLMGNQRENTTVSIVRMNEDGKPDDASDHSSDETVPHINVTVDAFFDSYANEDGKEPHNDYVSDLFGSEIPLIGFQNDHCYTPLTSPSQSRRNSDCDPILYKEEIVTHGTSKSYIPSSKKITVLENKVIAKGKNVQYYTSGSREILKGSDLLKRPISSQNIHLVRKIDVNKHQLKSVDNENLLNKRLSRHDSFDERSAIADHDTLIFNQDGNTKKSLLKKDVKKILSKKIELKNNVLANSSISIDSDQSVSNRNRKIIKSYSTQKLIDEKGKSYIVKNEVLKNNDGSKQILLLNSKLGNAEISKDLKPETKLIDTHKNQQKSVLKKDKKGPAHETALFNDSNILFSSPDIIRRVSTDTKAPKTPDQIPGNLLKKSDHFMQFAITSGDKINSDLTGILKPGSSKIDHKTQNINSKIAQNRTDISTRRNKNQKDGLDIMSPFDEESLAQLLQDPTSSEILSPVNIPLDIGPVTVQTQMLDKHDAANSSASVSALMSPNTLNSTGLNAPLSPNLDLLAGLHPEEEGLPEDLLRHVAQLVESSENLQEVIDKEVLGKVNIHPKNNLLKQVPNPALIPLTKIEHLPHQVLPESEKPQHASNVIRKEPIQIMRSNGRIITLPPIEAPATRSSKRKSLLNSVEINPGVSNPDVSKTSLLVQTPTKPINTYSRSHKASESKSSTQIPGEKKDDDVESDESWNSEDDPDRLWCICKQPHNNRFMICCDSCEDWFHGKCVNVTKAMGQEMEERGIEWRCPSCVKKKGLANPSLKSLTSLRKSTEARIDERASRISSDSGSLLDSNTNCIVCKKPARVSSIYCSDACILKHAQESLTLTSPTVTSTKINSLNKPKQETRVIVYERKTGKLLAGSNAPTTSNLKTWLQEHPTYEVVQPGTSANKSPTTLKAKPKPNTPKFQSVLTVGQDKQISFVSPSLKSPPTPVKQLPKAASQSPSGNLKSPTLLNRPQTPKVAIKSPPPVKVQIAQQKQTPQKSPVPSTSQKKEETTPHRFSNSIEPIRENVKKTLCEEISKRMAESKDVKFTQEEILKFSIDTEYELHDLFKDVGAKYKVKYRSLMFNLKDRKNLTLWQKICDRSITPKQLVRLSPEELASQELAQWRDKEAKHQLELIKKSELDLLACSKTIVLKTHKGEEVMESRTTDTAELDPNVAVEDLVSALNKSVDDNENLDGDKPASPTPSSRDKSHSSHHKHSRHKSKSSKSSKSSSNRDHSSSRRESSSSKHRSSKDSRSGSRSHHRKSSRDRNRKSSSSRKHSESNRHSSHSKSSKYDDKKHSNENRRSSSSSKDDRNSKELEHKKNVNEFKMDIIGLENIRSPVLYDTKVDEAGNDLLSPNSDSLKSPLTPETGGVHKALGNTESDQEPTSTMDSMIWNGIINMIDVARFSVTAYEVSGQCDDIIQELESELDVVGRISPDTVWDYISKMRKQGYNDISVLRFIAAADEDKTQYSTLYNYLSTRSRLGVIKANVGLIKDFYILPLASQASLPSVLLPIQGPGFEESKPHLLLGIIVKQRKKRVSHFPTLSTIPSKISKLSHTDRSYTPPTDSSYTPPSSPKRKTLTSGMPLPSFLPNSSSIRDKIAASLVSGDDEPYSPGGSDNSGSLDRSHSPAIKQSKTTSDDLQKKMEELTRKIEEEKKQIENITVTISGDSLDEPYSPSRPMSPSSVENPLTGLSSISLPSNLQEILASIQKKTKGPNSDVIDSQNTAEPYVPQPVLNTVNPYFKESFSGDVDMRMINSSVFPPQIPNFIQNQPDMSQKSTGKLSTLSEAELLSMVPDDEVLLPSNKMNPVYPPLPNIPPPSIVTNTSVPPPPFKRQKIEYGQPPPPGFEDL